MYILDINFKRSYYMPNHCVIFFNCGKQVLWEHGHQLRFLLDVMKLLIK